MYAQLDLHMYVCPNFLTNLCENGVNHQLQNNYTNLYGTKANVKINCHQKAPMALYVLILIKFHWSSFYFNFCIFQHNPTPHNVCVFLYSSNAGIRKMGDLLNKNTQGSLKKGATKQNSVALETVSKYKG